MKINHRLKKIATYVEKDSKVLDIGCDHALLDIYLIREEIARECVAADIKEGPLQAAKENIRRYQLDHKIQTQLGDGLDVYQSDIDTVIISGLGGKTMQGIFSRHLDVLKTVHTIVLSPNNYQADIKKYLCKRGFYIAEETFVKEHNIVYQIIKFKQGKRKYCRRDYFFGPVLRKNKDILFQEFYQRELKSREILLALLPKNFRLKRFQIKKEMKLLKEELESSK